MMLIILIFLIILSIVVCYFVAKRRGADPIIWGVMGGIFGPFAVPFVFFSKPKPKQND